MKVMDFTGFRFDGAMGAAVAFADIVGEEAGQEREQDCNRTEEWRDHAGQRLHVPGQRAAKRDQRQKQREAEIKHDKDGENSDGGQVEPGSDHENSLLVEPRCRLRLLCRGDNT